VASTAFVGLLAVTVNVAVLQSSQQDRLMDEAVASHVRSTVGQHLVDVASSDQHTVKPFLSQRLGFSPPVRELQLPGSVFVGGRVDYLGGRPVAALVYRQGEHVVNSFVWPDTAGGDTAPEFALERGFRIAHWAQGGMRHCVISDVNRDEFQRVVDSVRLAAATG
jgi:anti-sigma factor RsiW